MDKYEIYTDGACSQNGTQDGGWAAVVYKNGNQENILKGKKKDTTNNEMELSAFLSALEFISDEYKNNKNSSFSIFTDSAYISNCFLQKWYVKWIKNGWKTAKKENVKHKEVWEKIISIFLSFDKETLSIEKVKGHSTIKGNIYADKIANEEKDSLKKESSEKSIEEIKEMLK